MEGIEMDFYAAWIFLVEHRIFKDDLSMIDFGCMLQK